MIDLRKGFLRRKNLEEKIILLWDFRLKTTGFSR